jgi:hypothetical protein
MPTKDTSLINRILEDQHGNQIEINVVKPQQNGQDWITHWTISGLPDGEINASSGGVDSMQSLVFALAMIGDRIAAENADLTFLNSPELQLLHTVSDPVNGEWVATVRAKTS